MHFANENYLIISEEDKTLCQKDMDLELNSPVHQIPRYSNKQNLLNHHKAFS